MTETYIFMKCGTGETIACEFIAIVMLVVLLTLVVGGVVAGYQFFKEQRKQAKTMKDIADGNDN